MDPHIHQHIDETLVFFLPASSKEASLRFLSGKLAEKAFGCSPEMIEKAIFQRERLMSTGIGTSIAIPHAKLANLQRFFIAIGIFDHGVDWNSVDSSPVRIVFMIIGPENQPDEYLQLLSAITHCMRSEHTRRTLLSAKSPEIVVRALQKQ